MLENMDFLHFPAAMAVNPVDCIYKYCNLRNNSVTVLFLPFPNGTYLTSSHTEQSLCLGLTFFGHYGNNFLVLLKNYLLTFKTSIVGGSLFFKFYYIIRTLNIRSTLLNL